MGNTFSGFRSFMEDMDPSPEKDREGSSGDEPEDYFSALGDEDGMDWHDLVKALQAEPWISAHFPLGRPDQEVLYKLSPWQIVKGSMTKDGADIRLKPTRKARSYLQGNVANKSGYQDGRRYHVSREELANMLTAGWGPAVQAAQAAQAGV